MYFKPASFFRTRRPIAFSLMVILISLNLLTAGCRPDGPPKNTPDPLPVSDSNKDLYGGIEIGSKGVKATVLGFKYSQPKNAEDSGRVMQEVMPLETTNTNVMEGLDNDNNFAAAKLEDTVKAVKKYYDKLRDQKVIPEQIYVVGSSGLLKASQTSRNSLKDKVVEATNLTMVFLTPQQESEYSIAGIIPKDRRSTACLLDIGSGNTKGGYLENYDTDPHYVTADVALGIVTATNEMDKAATSEAEKAALKELEKSNKTDIKNVIYAERVRANTFEPALSKELASKAGLVNRKHMYLSGGINWALATLTHPGVWDSDGMVHLTVQDINDFTYLAKVDPQRLLHPDLSSIKDEETRKRVEKDIQRIGDTFNAKNLMAGGELLQALINVCKLRDKDKRIYFARFGQTGWLYKFIETTVENKLRG